METKEKSMRTVDDVRKARQEMISLFERGERNLSFTGIKELESSPRDMINYYIGLSRDTQAMRNSKQTHVMVLEGPDVWDKQFIYQPIAIPYPSSEHGRNFSNLVALDGVEPEAAYRESYACEKKTDNMIARGTQAKMDEYGRYMEFLRKAGGREIVLEKDWRLMVEQREVLLRDPLFAAFLESCEVEIEVRDWEFDGIKFNGRVDMARPDGNGTYIEGADLKVYARVQPRYFQRVIFNELLHVQSAVYCKMMGIPFERRRWYIWAVDKTFGNIHYMPYNIREDALEMGWQKFQEMVKWFKHCQLSASWNRSYGFYAEDEHGVYDVHCPWWYEG